MQDKKRTGMDRREFLGTTAATAFMVVSPRSVRGSTASSAVRLGLLGCGGRGTWVATSFLNNTDARLVALGDLFSDQLEKAKKYFDALAEKRGQAGIDRSQIFAGGDSWRKIADSKEVDAVIVATPPYYHPEHLEVVAGAGKHIYLEKPVAVDVQGCKRVLRAGEKARGKVSMDVGFQVRYSPPYAEMVRRIHAGALGKIGFAQAHFYTGAGRRPDWPGAPALEVRLRNWHYDRVLSGDILVEQGIHLVDVCNWILGHHPLKAVGSGGRQVRDDPGNVWDHYSVVYHYPGDLVVNFNSTQFIKGWWDACVRCFGGRGVAECHYVGGVRIHGEEPWDSGFGQDPKAGVYDDALKEADPEKERFFIRSITTGQFHDESKQGAEATLSAILGRTAAYTGKEVTWEEIMRSDQAWDAGIDLAKLLRS